MKKQLQGIALILFGILLNCADPILNSTILRSLSDFPFALTGVIIGIIGLVFSFRNAKEKEESTPHS